MFACLALIFSYVEAIIPFSVGIPGVKLGIANLVVIIALYDSFIRADIYVEAAALKIGDHLVNYTDKFFI
jgi:heptaprenyl diphosphate synthase